MEKFNDERNKVIFSFDIEAMRQFCEKYNIFCSVNDDVVLCSMAKAAMNIVEAPREVTEKAKEILSEHGMTETII